MPVMMRVTNVIKSLIVLVSIVSVRVTGWVQAASVDRRVLPSSLATSDTEYSCGMTMRRSSSRETTEQLSSTRHVSGERRVDPAASTRTSVKCS